MSLAQVQRIVSRYREAKMKPNVEGFLLHLSGALTQYDMRASKRRGYNPNALGLYMQALDRVRKDTSSIKKSEEKADLETLKKSIQRRFDKDFPPVKKTVKAIDEFLASGKAPSYPVSRSAAEDVWLDREVVAKFCPSCADKMASLGIRQVRASVLFADERLLASALEPRAKTAARWEDLPPGWDASSRKKFWDSLVGDVKHKVTKCIERMKDEKGIDDPGAFCAALADRIEGKGWRGGE